MSGKDVRSLISWVEKHPQMLKWDASMKDNVEILETGSRSIHQTWSKTVSSYIVTMKYWSELLKWSEHPDPYIHWFSGKENLLCPEWSVVLTYDKGHAVKCILFHSFSSLLFSQTPPLSQTLSAKCTRKQTASHHHYRKCHGQSMATSGVLRSPMHFTVSRAPARVLPCWWITLRSRPLSHNGDKDLLFQN